MSVKQSFRRGHGDGSIDARGPGRYRLRWRVGDKRFSKSFHGSMSSPGWEDATPSIVLLGCPSFSHHKMDWRQNNPLRRGVKWQQH
jgi:hypothetical protein